MKRMMLSSNAGPSLHRGLNAAERVILEEERIGDAFVMWERRPQGAFTKLYKITAHLPLLHREAKWEIVTYQTNSMTKAQEHYVWQVRELAKLVAAQILMGKPNG